MVLYQIKEELQDSIYAMLSIRTDNLDTVDSTNSFHYSSSLDGQIPCWAILSKVPER